MEIKKREVILENVKILSRQLFLENLPDDRAIFYHNVNFGGLVDFDKKHIVSTIDVTIHQQDNENLLGSLKVYFYYKISDFDSIFFVKNSTELNQESVELFNTLTQESIATTRGMMLEQFRGTFLHNAYLPVVMNLNFTENLVEVVKNGKHNI